MDFTDQLIEMRNKAEWAPSDTKIQLDLYQKAINFIDANNIKSDLAIEIKSDYIDCADNLGFTKLMLPQFSWILKQMDEVGMENFNSTYDTLWMYKWMMTFIVNYSDFPKAKVLKMFEDMSRRFLAYSDNKHVIYDYAYFVYHGLGMTKEALENKEKLLAFEGRGILSDCSACVTKGIGDKIFDDLKFEEYLAVTDAIIKGKATCGSVPQTSNSRIALAYLFVEGLSESTKKFAKREKKDISADENCLSFCSYAIIYRVIIGDLDQAINLANCQIAHLFNPVDDMDKVEFTRACLFLSKHLKSVGKEWTGLPDIPDLTIPTESKEDFLYQYFKDQFDGLLNAFDTRNENTVFSEREKKMYDYFVSYEM